jgi:predicted dehydrogenase/glycosyltransferase involved in cell wall biosynthesis/NADPH:quinone reductase-like Zn-dependent oxidoreductase
VTRHYSMPLAGYAPTGVVLATDSRDPSGVGHHMIALARHLGPDFRPVLGFATGPAATFVKLATKAGLQSQAVDDTGWADWIASQSAQILHVHAGIGWEGHALTMAGRAAGMAVLRTEHLPWLITDPVERQDYLAALRNVDGLISVSRSAAVSWQRALAHAADGIDLRIVANGVVRPRPLTNRDLMRKNLGIGRDDRLILHAGRFTAQKAQDVLVAAFAIVKAQVPAAHLLMIGTGETRETILSDIIAMGLRDARMEASRPDLAEVMGAADLFVLPSRFEGMPLVLLEAMALGVPVVATRVAGIADALGAEHPGLVAPDDAAALAEAICNRLATPELARTEGDRLSARFREGFTAERMACNVASTYRNALRTQSAQGSRPAMQTITRIGFVGSGGIAERHLGVLRDFADVKIVAVADPDRHRAAASAEPFGARVHEDVASMINAGGLDALFICVPPFAHGPAERAAVAANLPFFVEKPVSLDLALAEEIADAVDAAGLITAVGYHWRYLDTLDTARRALGDRVPQLMVGHWLDQTPPPAWWGKASQSGGQFVEQVTHLIDAARVLAGPVRSVYAQGNHLSREGFRDLDVPTSGAATLTFETGAVASFTATCLLNWNHRTGLHVFAEGLAVEFSDMDVMVDTGRGRHPIKAEGDPVWREDRDFIDAVQGKPNAIRTPYGDAVESHRVALAIAQSMQTGQVLHLSAAALQPMPPVGTLRQRPALPHEHRRVRSLGVEAARRAYFFDYDEGPAGDGQVRLDLCYTGLSAGTELTFLKGTNPYLHARWDDDAAVFRGGEPQMRYPIPFMGYMESARVIDSRADGFAQGMIVGATFGHKTGHTADPARGLLVPLPVGMDPILGIFVAQMGPIAANGILHADALSLRTDASFGAGVEGRRVVVWGGGTVGLFTALFAREAGAADVIVAEPSAFRRAMAERLDILAMPEDDAWQHAKGWGNGVTGRGADLVFQTRARSESLHLAMRALRPQGKVIDLAFYQGGMDGVRLGEEFHHNGLMLICAQIGRVPQGMGESWTRARLSAETLRLLGVHGSRIRDAMITHVVPFTEGPEFLTHLIDERPEFLQIVFSHAP